MIEPGLYEFRVVRVRKDNGETESVLPYMCYMVDDWSTLKRIVTGIVNRYVDTSVSEPKVSYKWVRDKPEVTWNDLN